MLRDGYLPSDALAEQIQEQVKRTIAPYKYPRPIEFVPVSPKTPSGKINRRELCVSFLEGTIVEARNIRTFKSSDVEMDGRFSCIS